MAPDSKLKHSDAQADDKSEFPVTSKSVDYKRFRFVSCPNASFAVDIATATFSVMDVACDILVTYEYYLQGRMRYFYSSIDIFALAQLTYAFLFTATYCKSVRVQERVWVFCAVLPVAQLYPVFAWLETLRIPQLAAILRAAGLRDTISEPMSTSDASTYSAPTTAEDANLLLAYICSPGTKRRQVS